MTSVPSRRKFLQSAAVAAAGVTIVPRHVLGGSGFQAPSDTFNVAGVGCRRHGPQQPHRARQPEHRRALRRRLRAGRSQATRICDSQLAQARKQIADLKANPNARRRRAQGANLTPEQRLRNAEQRAANVERPHREGRQGQALPGLPPDAGGAEGHRRRRGRDARPHPRRHRHGGDVAGQARLRAEAAVLVGARGARPGEEGGGDQGRHADGQPGALARRRPQGHRVRAGRLHRRRHRGPHLDQPAARLLATGRAAPGRVHDQARGARLEHARRDGAAGGDPRRGAASGAGRPGVGPVPRPGADRAVPPDLPPDELARLGRLGPGSPRRHGRAPRRSPVLGARARHADDHRDGVDAVQRRHAIRPRR